MTRQEFAAGCNHFKDERLIFIIQYLSANYEDGGTTEEISKAYSEEMGFLENKEKSIPTKLFTQLEGMGVIERYKYTIYSLSKGIMKWLPFLACIDAMDIDQYGGFDWGIRDEKYYNALTARRKYTIQQVQTTAYVVYSSTRKEMGKYEYITNAKNRIKELNAMEMAKKKKKKNLPEEML